MVLTFPVLADYAVLPGKGSGWSTLPTAMCSSLNHLPPLAAPGDILLHGHTHVPAWTSRAGEPLPEPRLCKPAQGKHRYSYMTLEESTACWKTMEGVCYHLYSCDNVVIFQFFPAKAENALDEMPEML